MKYVLASLQLPPNLDSSFERLKHTSTGSHQKPQKPPHLAMRLRLQVKPSHCCRRLDACLKHRCSAVRRAQNGQAMHSSCCTITLP